MTAQVTVCVDNVNQEIEVYDWCFRNIKGKFRSPHWDSDGEMNFYRYATASKCGILLDTHKHYIEFENENEALLFKLAFA